jgi:hypothetical protein
MARQPLGLQRCSPWAYNGAAPNDAPSVPCFRSLPLLYSLFPSLSCPQILRACARGETRVRPRSSSLLRAAGPSFLPSLLPSVYRVYTRYQAYIGFIVYIYSPKETEGYRVFCIYPISSRGIGYISGIRCIGYIPGIGCIGYLSLLRHDI